MRKVLFHRLLKRLSPWLLLGAAACADPLALGTRELDARRLSESNNLNHLFRALGEDLTLRGLFERGDGADPLRAPDPTSLLERTSTRDDARAGVPGVRVSVLSQNVALLDAKLLGFIDYARTPLLDERREALPAVFLEGAPKIVLLQEVWLPEDVDGFQAAAEARGYLAFPGSREGHNDGLMTLIHGSLVEDESAMESGVVAYQAQDGLEHFPGPGIKRGYQWVRFSAPQLGTLVVFNTHMQAFPGSWKQRLSQARELGLAVLAKAGDEALAFVGGDLNAGPYYKKKKWALPDGSVDGDWWQNAFSYPVLLEYGGLEDLFIMGKPLAEAARDVTLGDTVVNDPARALEVPGAEEGFCEGTPHTTFTVSDCNALYFAQYGGTEYPARIDHVLVRDVSQRVFVERSAVVFAEPLDFGGQTSEPSDHYGVRVDLVIEP